MNLNLSDYDSDNYSSDEDADYVPSDEDYSEDDVNELVKEDDLDRGQENTQEKKKKKSSKDISARKRKKGGLSLEGEIERRDEADQEESEEKADPLIEIKEDKVKKASDDLWASFLSDVGQKPQTASVQPPPLATGAIKSQGETKEAEKPKESSKVTITKVFDFAGEEVRVTKEVDADSKEAKFFLKKQQGEETEQQSPPRPESSAEPTASSGGKRPAGIGSILNRIGGKKQKMSTLEKSKLDWDSFKNEEGIGEELATHNRGKEGYVERKAFLERVDHRRFELEKSLRLSNMKR
ncbi:craniofacial development protein 1-like isoform X1 [Acipenser ruthenus]|uniref:craniofacial development protein 1-like isoform X1 n=1 Tax=Acipenser ruthenus TaxID=7906 RepID=UPI00145A36CC|nr:craniofacial development protein 1-like isoform X1 [Acipenser ruthenus]